MVLVGYDYKWVVFFNNVFGYVMVYQVDFDKFDYWFGYDVFFFCG